MRGLNQTKPEQTTKKKGVENEKNICTSDYGGIFLLTPVFAGASNMTGTIQGYNSLMMGKASPMGQDVHIPAHVVASETTFVLLDGAAKGKHFLIQNVDRAVLARFINQQVKIEGDINNRTESIRAENIYTSAPDKSWEKVWARNPLDNIYLDVFGSHPLSGL